MSDRISYCAVKVAEKYSRQVGHCPFYLFEDLATGALSGTVVKPNRSWRLVSSDPIPKGTVREIEDWIRTNLTIGKGE